MSGVWPDEEDRAVSDTGAKRGMNGREHGKGKPIASARDRANLLPCAALADHSRYAKQPLSGRRYDCDEGRKHLRLKLAEERGRIVQGPLAPRQTSSVYEKSTTENIARAIPL